MEGNRAMKLLLLFMGNGSNQHYSSGLLVLGIFLTEANFLTIVCYIRTKPGSSCELNNISQH